ncbi:MAG: nucleotidyltransferase domain-containing protein [Caldilineaceae bacterium]
MMTMCTIQPEELAVYKATAQRRWQAEQAAVTQRRAQAMVTARQAARFLKEHFGATRVMLFGSLVHNQWFSASSDIDLAAWGIKDEEFYRAVARLQDLSSEFKIDLVAMERCPQHLYQTILAEGTVL